MSSSEAKREMNPDRGHPDIHDSGSEGMRANSPSPLRFTSRPRLEPSPFIVGWTNDTGHVSRLAADYLIKASDAGEFCQIEPAGFYPVGGVTVVDDVAQFPQSRFYHSQTHPAVILRADEPQSDRHEFLNVALDLARNYGKASALYTVNGIAALTAHTTPRRVFGVFNDAAMQNRLQPLVPSDASWQGPPHVSTYLLWLAGRRHLPGLSLWVEVPFYLSDYEDHQAVKAAVSLLSIVLGWELDLGELTRLAAEQNGKLAQLEDDPDTAEKIRALEEGLSLNKREQEDLIEAVKSALKGSS